jgi:hypothetical protein
MYQISTLTARKCDTNRDIKAIKLLSRLDNHIPKYLIRIEECAESIARFLFIKQDNENWTNL